MLGHEAKAETALVMRASRLLGDDPPRHWLAPTFRRSLAGAENLSAPGRPN